ncbi:hypothetical protein ABEB22_10845 [Thioclava sp. 'Guangxiensis']|uniref:hypothetical protein n=1 Tax=Thioclava sp. 'Guangxiensis' TaxID=3149044 RepID=UPI0038781B8E
MAELDPRLQPLLNAVMRCPLAPLGTSALARLDAAEGDRARFDDDDDDDRDPLAPSPRETDWKRANRQLKILDAVIGGRLRLDIELLESSQSLARELSSLLDRRDFDAFTAVLVMPDEAGFYSQEGVGEENLLSGARLERLKHTLHAWDRAINAAGDAIGKLKER